MSEYEPLMSFERKSQAHHAKAILAETGMNHHVRLLAATHLRYEATLQAKDAQIAALVTALREIKGMTHCDALGDRFMRAQQVAMAAIKGVTDGS